MSFNYRVAGYVKLAKLWEKNKEVALSYHKRYYKEKCDKTSNLIFYRIKNRKKDIYLFFLIDL